MSDLWTGEAVLVRLKEAAKCLRAVRVGRHSTLMRVAGTPEPIPEPDLAYGYDKARAPAPRYSADQMDRMDECLDWLRKWLTVSVATSAGLVPDSGLIVWWRATGWSYRRIAEERKERAGLKPGLKAARNSLPGGNNRGALASIEAKALDHIARCLNAASVQQSGATAALVREQGERRSVQAPSFIGDFERNAQPCGTCFNFYANVPRKRTLPTTTHCRKFGGMDVATLDYANHTKGQPCWTPKPREER